MPNLNQFADNIDKLADRIGENVEKTIAKTGEAVGSNLINDTPVDTGRARLNWQTTIDRPAQGTRPAPHSPHAGLETALRENRTVSRRYTLGHKIWLVNNVPYIEALNHGSSRQAPAMFVEKAVERGAKVAREQEIVDGD